MRKATRSDIQHINKLTEMAKSIMEHDQNPQWDHRYPLEKHFYEDIDNGDLYLYEETMTLQVIYVSIKYKPNGINNLTGQLIPTAHMSFIEWLQILNIKVSQ